MKLLTGIAVLSTVLMSHAGAAIITFDDALSGQTTYDFDGDGDSTVDVRFSTTDPGGFNTVGPGPNMNYVNEPGLEGTSTLNPDLRVDFLNGAVGTLRFGFALLSSASPSYFANFRVFDANNNELGSATTAGAYTATSFGQSDYPEGIVTVNFSGLAAYGLFNFESEGGRYLMDNFEGTFGSTEAAEIAAGGTDTPEPATTALLGAGLAGIALLRRRLS